MAFAGLCVSSSSYATQLAVPPMAAIAKCRLERSGAVRVCWMPIAEGPAGSLAQQWFGDRAARPASDRPKAGSRIRWGLRDALLLIIFGLCGAVIYIAVFLLLTTVSFWVEDRVGVHPPVWNMIAFGRYPLSIYSELIRFLLSWIIPFGFASFYPSVRLLGRAELRNYAPLVPVVTAVFMALALLVWSRGVRHYASTGS